ncbi:MAG: cupin-like domain-containing protein [Myxococcales bacterium]|nr:cupin-like domain-containing protein [Myxococcales bacterium]
MSASVEQRLGLDWELWVVELLLFSGKRDAIVQQLVVHGIDAASAEAQVERIASSEGFARLRLRVREGDLASRLQRLQTALAGSTDVPVRPTIDAATLHAEHWVPSLPVKLTEAARQLAAVRTWTLQWLGERFGQVELLVNTRRTQASTARQTEEHLTRMPLAEFVAHAQSRDSNDLYVVSRCGLLGQPGLEALWDDLAPLPEFLVPSPRPTGVSLWLGPKGTVTPPHFDPHNVLLVQVQGRKRIRLAPRLRAHQHDLLDGYYLRGDLDEAFGDAVRTVELQAGEALFVPVGWFHEVTALSPSITLSLLSFPWENHFHWLGPPGSDDPR